MVCENITAACGREAVQVPIAGRAHPAVILSPPHSRLWYPSRHSESAVGRAVRGRLSLSADEESLRALLFARPPQSLDCALDSEALAPSLSSARSILCRLCQKSAHKSPFSSIRLRRFFMLNFSGFRVDRSSLISTGVDTGAFGKARTV